MVRKRTWWLAVVAALVVPTVGIPATADEHARVEVLVSGLDAPRGVAVGPDGAVYVANSGTGGDEHCFEEVYEDETGEEEVVEVCAGTTSTVTRVAPDGSVDREHVAGLPSIMHGDDAVGASDVTVAPDGTLYVTIGLGDAAGHRDEIAEDWAPAAALGTLIEVAEDGTYDILADLAAWESENDPDGESDLPEGVAGSDSNPNGAWATADTVYVADAGGNTVLAVDRGTGAIELAAVVRARMVPMPPFIGAGMMPMQSVATNVTVSPDGDVVFSELTGFPFPVGGARVHAVTDDPEAPEVVADGFTAAMGLAYRDGELFVAEFAHVGLLSVFGGPEPQFAGALVRERANGARLSLLRDVLQLPGGVAAGPDGMLYVSSGSVFPGGGTLVRFDPSMAADPAIQAACPPDGFPGALLTDVLGNVHEEAIHCLDWYDVVRGRTDGTFGPRTTITRGQFAAVVARMIRGTDTALPPAQQQRFSDVAGTTHAADIGALARAGVINGYEDGTFRPNRPITRAQAASMVVSSYTLVTGAQPPSAGDAFGDDDGSVHESAIDRAAAAGWLRGTGPREFSPQRSITRGQTASVLGRMMATLVVEGELSLPS